MMLDDDATSDLVWDLINAGADVKLKDNNGNTALMQAAASDNLETLKVLLDAGAAINTRNSDGRSALLIAASEGYVNIVRALVLAGADINATDDEGKNAVGYAAENDHASGSQILEIKRRV